MKETTKATHTPGPWIATARDNRGWIGIAQESGGTLGHLPDFPAGSAAANAALIAAAPDLAAALSALVAECSAARTPTVAQWNAAHDALRKAGLL